MTAVSQPAGQLRRLPLRDLHLELGARMAPFAGYEMPINYARGVLNEHLDTRSAAGLFDISHMGQIVLRPQFGRLDHVAQALEYIMPANVRDLRPGRQRYTYLTNSDGGIIDDLIIGRLEDVFILVVNATRKEGDRQNIRNRIADVCAVDSVIDHVLLALQGPKSEFILAQLAPEVAKMDFMEIRSAEVCGVSCVVSRSGYTGEDGFEISVHERDSERLARVLLKNSDVTPIGLGARDSLRTEAGLCLYGADLDEKTTPVEAALEWAIPSVRRSGGARAGQFPGADVVLEQIERGAERRRVGIKSHDGTPLRPGVQLYATNSDSKSVGKITSGGFGPSLNAPIAMGYVPNLSTRSDSVLFADVRGTRRLVKVVDLPFVSHRYKRK